MMAGALLLVCTLSAQPGWVSKAAKSVFTVKTFGADGALLGSANGFFISEQGDAVSSFAPFSGAVRAVVIDASGKEMPVEYMIGANEMYDVVKFRVSGKKIQPLDVAVSNATTGQQVFMLPYSVKKPEAISGQLDKAETFQESYAYYTVKMQMPENTVGCPLLNADGEVIGLMQQPARQGDALSYAIGVRFVSDMQIGALSMNDASLRKIHIKLALPDKMEEGSQVVLTGSIGANRTFTATDVALEG